MSDPRKVERAVTSSVGTWARSVEGAAALEAEGITKSFGTFVALDDVSVRVDPGEICAVLGPNGAGKTTLLRIMSGMVIPDSGRVSVLGTGAGRGVVAPRGAVGLVPSGDRSFYLRLSGLENLVFFGRLHGLRLHDARRRSNELLELTGLTDAAQLAVGRYSHGMQRRLAMARALLAEPRVMLVDEATHDLDPEGARRIRALVTAVASRGAAVVWTTQRLEEVRDFADNVTVIHRGQVRFSGGVSAFLARASTRVFVVSLAGSPARAPERASVALAEAGSVRERPGDTSQLVLSLAEGVLLGEALVQLVNAGFEIESVREERSAIEDVFLQLTAGDAG